jgi:hypothetical protein
VRIPGEEREVCITNVYISSAHGCSVLIWLLFLGDGSVDTGCTSEFSVMQYIALKMGQQE